MGDDKMNILVIKSTSEQNSVLNISDGLFAQVRFQILQSFIMQFGSSRSNQVQKKSLNNFFVLKLIQTENTLKQNILQ